MCLRINDVKMVTKIDTVEIETNRSNISIEYDTLREEAFIKGDALLIKPKKNQEDEVIMALQPSKAEGLYNGSSETYKFSYYKQRKTEMLTGIRIKVLDEVKVNRVDLCFDLDCEFNSEIYPLLEFLALLYSLEYTTQNAWKNVSLFNLKENAIMVKANRNELAIYNKRLESNNQHLYNTRIEFRFKGIRAEKDVEEKKLDDLNDLLDQLMGNIEAATEARVNTLYERYQKELADGTSKDFTEFVRHNKNLICTRDILKGAYDRTDLKGNFENWVRYFKRNYTICLYNTTNILDFIGQMKKALRKYKRS